MENFSETSIETTNILSQLLVEGYTNVNSVNFVCITEEDLIEHLTDQITTHFGEIEFKILEIKKEFKPTNYIKNNRPLMTFVVETENNQHVFVFDVASSSINFS